MLVTHGLLAPSGCWGLLGSTALFFQGLDMSHKATAWAWEQPLPHAAKLVLLYIADAHNGNSGRCFPATATIAKGCGMSRSTVVDYIARLASEEFGTLISREQRTLDNGKRTSSEYFLHFDRTHDRQPVSRCPPAGHGPRPPAGHKPGMLEPGMVSEAEASPAGRPAKITFRPARVTYLPTEPTGLHDRDIAAAKERKVYETEVPEKQTAIWNRWDKIGRKHKEGTRAKRDGIVAVRTILRGTFFESIPGYASYTQSYTVADVLEALRTFHQKRNNPEYLPVDKTFLKNLGLADFFWSPHMRNGNTSGGGSMFIECLTTKPVLAADQSPELTAWVRDRFGYIKHEELDLGTAVRMANKFSRYWKANDLFLRGHRISTPKLLVTRWLGWLENVHPGSWTPGFVLAEGVDKRFEKHVINTSV